MRRYFQGGPTGGRFQRQTDEEDVPHGGIYHYHGNLNCSDAGFDPFLCFSHLEIFFRCFCGLEILSIGRLLGQTILTCVFSLATICKHTSRHQFIILTELVLRTKIFHRDGVPVYGLCKDQSNNKMMTSCYSLNAGPPHIKDDL